MNSSSSGSQYDAEGLSKTVGGINEFRLPERPRFVSDLLHLRVDDAIYLLGGQAQIFRGASIDWVFERVIPLLDGTRTIPELLDDMPGLAEPILHDLLYLLQTYGLLEEGDHGLPDQSRSHIELQYGRQLEYFSRYLRVTGRWRSRYEVQRAVTAAQVLVIGSDEEVDGVVQQVRNMGMESVRKTSERTLERLFSGSCDLVVAVGGPRLQEEVVDLAIAANVAVLAFDPERYQLGPLFHPGASACMVCANLQLAERKDDLGTLDTFIARLWRRALIARAAQHILAHVTGLYHSTVLNAVERLDPINHEFTRQPVWRLPGCPACGHDVTPRVIEFPSGYRENLALLYHGNAVLAPWQMHDSAALQVHFSSGTQQLMSSAYLRHDWAPRVPLPRTNEDVGSTELLWNQRCQAGERAPTLEDLSHVMRYASGARVTELESGGYHLRRFTASAGNLGSAEMYVIGSEVADLASGLYHYSVVDDSLELLVPGDHRSQMVSWIGYEPTALCIIVGAVERQSLKYESKGYLYCLLDAGLIVHRIELLAQSLGLKASIHTDFPDAAVASFLNVDSRRLAPCAMVALGNAEDSCPGGTR